MGLVHREQSKISEEGVALASFNSVFQSSQHSFRPDWGWREFSLLAAFQRAGISSSRLRHYRCFDFHLCPFPAFAINLHAPLPSCAFCSDALFHGQARFSVFGTIGTLTPANVHFAGRSPRLPRATFPSFRPQPRGTPHHRFVRHRSVMRYFQASPRGRGLAAIRRRIRFVILRTDSSLPVTLHPASRRRSYLPLRSCGQLRQGLSPCKWHALTGVRPPAEPEAYLYELRHACRHGVA